MKFSSAKPAASYINETITCKSNVKRFQMRYRCQVVISSKTACLYDIGLDLCIGINKQNLFNGVNGKHLLVFYV